MLGSGVSRSVSRARNLSGVIVPAGCTPVSARQNITPTAQMSEAWSTSSAPHCSGDMYGSVPTREPLPENVTYVASASTASISLVSATGAAIRSRSAPTGESKHFATPKSRTFTEPRSVTKMFEGLRSRCTMPCSCARSSARATGIMSSTNARTVIRCSRSCDSVLPSRYSSTMNGRPWCSPTSKMVTMFSCVQRAVARASITKRLTKFGSSWSKNLIATLRPSFVSRARKTWPMPPRASSRISPNRPICCAFANSSG